MSLRHLLVLLLTFCTPLMANAATQETDPFSIQSLASRPAIMIPKNASTNLQDFVVIYGDNKGAAAPLITNMRIGYNDHALTIEFSLQYEDDQQIKAEATEGRDRGFHDDSIEIFLTPNPDNYKSTLHFGGNAAGVWWDRPVGANSKEWSWNPEIQYTSGRGKMGGWNGKFVIPFKAIGLEPPKVGDIWRANFMAKRHLPARTLHAWAFRDQWKDWSNDGYLVFGDKQSPYFTIRGNWKQMWNSETKGPWPGIVTRGDIKPLSHRIGIDFRVLRRDVDPSSDANFHTELVQRRAQATGEAATFATFEEDVDAVLAKYPQVIKRVVPGGVKRVPDPSYSVMWGPRSIKLDREGDYFWIYRYEDITDPDRPIFIAGGGLPVRIRSGVQVAVQPYILTRRSVIVTADLRAVNGVGKTDRLRAYITDEADRTVYEEITVDLQGTKKQNIELSIKSLPVDHNYRAHVELLDEKGNLKSASFASFPRPADPDWWVNRDVYGTTPEVPQPWAPIDWREGTARVWGRTITLGQSLLPQQIISRSTALLASPMRLELTANGKVQPWTNRTFEVVEQADGHLLLRTAQEAAGVRIRGVHRLEFDGFSLIDLHIEPIGKSAKVDGLEMVMPVKQEHATFLTNYRAAPGPGRQGRYVGRTPDRYTSPVMITTWLGTDHYGLEFSCDSSRDWVLQEPNTAVEVARENGVVTARYQFIDHTFEISRPRHIRFGLIATPTKSVPLKHQRWRTDRAGTALPPADPEVLKKWRNNYYGQIDILAKLAWRDWTGNHRWNPRVTDPAAKAKLIDIVSRCKAEGQVLMPYGGWGIPVYSDEWDPWGKEMVAFPKTNTIDNQFIGTYGSPYVEFMVGSWALNARETGINGMRNDTVVPWKVSANPYLGETWIDEVDGKTYGTQNLFRQREMFKRIWRIFNGGETEDGVIYLGAAGPPIMAVFSFVNIRETAEGHYMHAHSIKKAYPQDQVRPWMTATAYGFIDHNNLKGSPLHTQNRIGPLLAAGCRPRFSPKSRIQQRDYSTPRYSSEPAYRIWDAWSWVDRATAKWCPHWDNQDLIDTSVPGNAEHYVSFRLQPGRRILLVAVNYEQKPVTVRVRLHLKKLGFDSNIPLHVRDAITGKDLPISHDTVDLACGPELYRYVMIGPIEEINGPFLDPDHKKLKN